MKLNATLAVIVLLGAPAFSSTSNAVPIGGLALSGNSATAEMSSVTKVHKRRHARQRYHRQRFASRRKWRPRYWAYYPYYSRPLYLDSPYYYSTSPYGYPFHDRFGSPYSTWYRGGPVYGYGW